MPDEKKINWKLRANVSIQAKENVKQVKSKLILRGLDFNQMEVVDYMLKHFNEEMKPPVIP